MNVINTIMRHRNGAITVNGFYSVIPGDETGLFKWSDVDSYAKTHPDVLIPESLPPELTPEERAVQRRAAIITELNALDAQAVQYIRATIEGTIDKEGTRRYEVNKKRVKELKAELQTLK